MKYVEMLKDCYIIYVYYLRRTPNSMEKTVRIAIIGIGGMGKKYAIMINDGMIPRMKLAAVCARSRENKEWARENLNEDVRFYDDSEELFNNTEDYDAVLIATPHKLHPEEAIRAFEAGKHVLCEKPSGVSIGDARRMQAAAAAADRKYAMMFHNRTFPVFKTLKKLIDENAIGKINRVILENSIYYRTAFYHASGSWRSSWKGEGGGALINQGQHIIDYWQWLFGMPDSIYASIPFGKYNDFKVDDEATIIMEYPEKMTGVFILSTGEIQSEEQLCIIGSKGKIRVIGNRIQIERNNIDAQEYSKTAKTNSREEMITSCDTVIAPEAQKPYALMLENFCEAILDDAELIADGMAGANTLEIANAAYMSAWLGKKINLPVDGNEYDRLLQEHAENE